MRIYSALNPTEILALLPSRAQHVLSEWQFEAPPLLQATLSGTAAEFSSLSGKGQLWLGKTKLRGSLLNSASAGFVLKEMVAHCNEVQVSRDEGSGNGSLTYDFGRDALTIEHFKANLYPEALANWVDPAAARIVQLLHFTKPPNISVEGTVQSKQGARNDLRLHLHFENVNAQALTKKIAFLKDYQGQVSGELETRTETGSAAEFSVRGNLEVTDATVSHARLFAPLMARLEPLGVHEPLQVRLAFQLTPNALKLSSLQLVSDMLAVRLSGSVHLLGGFFDLAGNLDGGATRIHGVGTLSQPLWELNPAIRQ